MKDYVKSITVISDSFPKGQKTVAVALGLSHPVDGTKIDPAAFQVEGRTITAVYSNDTLALTKTGVPGNYLILWLNLEAEDQSCYVFTDGHEHHGPGGHGPGGPGGPGRPGGPPEDEGDPGSLPDPGAKGFKMHRNVRKRNPAPVVRLLADIPAEDGALLEKWDSPEQCTGEINLLVDEFQVGELEGMKYNLFIPRDYDENRTYPLVMFIPDASAVSDNPLVSLMQGNGGIEWMKPEAQAKHPCFVLVPQYDGEVSLTNDSFTCAPEIETIKDILDYVAGTYSVDRDRIYTTGQSMGCMASCELNIRYPDYFAASLLVAGQWDPEKMGKLTGNNFWICVARNDLKAFPGMNAVSAALEANGADVGHYTWDSRYSIEEFNSLAREAMRDGKHIRHTVFWDRGENGEERPWMGHDGTWPVVYSIEALRDWMFSNVRPRR